MVALVQHAKNTAVSATSCVVTLSPTGAGNLLVVCVSTAVNDALVTGVTLGGSGTGFAQRVAQTSNSFITACVWSNPACASGQTSLVVNLSTADDPCVDVYEVSGLPGAVLDQSVVHPLLATASTWTSNATPATTQPAEFVVALVGGFNNAATSTTITGPAGPWANETQLTPATGIFQLSGYQISSSTGPFTYSGTSNMTGTNNNYTAITATFMAASVVAPPAAALPGPSWRRRFQPWRRAAQLREEPQQPATAPIAATVSFTSVPGLAVPGAFEPGYPGTPPVPPVPYAPAAALPGPAWQRHFQPRRRAAQQRVQPAPVITCTGSVALVPMALTASGIVVPAGAAPLAAAPGPSWQRVFQPWMRAAQLRAFPPPVITASGSIALAPMAVSGSESASPEMAPATALPGPAWKRVFQPWRRAAGARVQPPAVITCTGSAALAPMAVTASAVVATVAVPTAAAPGLTWRRQFQFWRGGVQAQALPPATITAAGSAALAPMTLAGAVTDAAPPLAPATAAFPAPSWVRVFQPWRRAATARVQPAPVVIVSGGVAMAPMAVSGSESASPEMAPAAATPGPAWRRQYQPWRRAAGARVQPAPVITAAGSLALAPMALTGSVTGSPEIAPAAALPGTAWRQVFQPWRKAAQQRLQPPPAVTASGSVALAPMALSGSASTAAGLVPPAAALPGPSWRIRYQPWRRAATVRIQPPQPVTCSGSVALAPMAVNASAVIATVAVPPAAAPGPSWQNVFQPWRRAQQAQALPPPVITASGSVALAPLAIAASGTAVFETSPPAAYPGPSWQRVFQPWLRAAQLRQMPPPVATCTGSIALAPMGLAASAAVTLPAGRPANPGPSWRRVYQPWRRASQQRAQPPPPAAAAVTCTGSIALAPMATAGTAGNAITVTATQGGSTSNGILIRVKVLTGAAGLGATATQANTSAAALDKAITTTVTGSYVYGVPYRDNSGGLTAAASTTLLDDVNDATNGSTYGTCRTTSATGTPGSVTVGATTSDTGNVALAEITPAGTIAEDASSPASASTTSATTVSSPLFVPPPGSLLVAMVASDGGVGTVTMTVTDSSGLSWTPVVSSSAAGIGYGGVWTARVPVPPPVPMAAALPGLAWRRRFQPWRKAAGLRVQPAPVITCTGSIAMAPMATSATGTLIALLGPSAATALPGPSWRRVFQPWRRGVAVRVTPPTVSISGSLAMAPMELAGTDVVSAVAAPPALPGPSWRRVFQPWRRGAQSRAFPPPVAVCSGSLAMAPMAVTAARVNQSLGEVWRAPDRLNKSGGVMGP